MARTLAAFGALQLLLTHPFLIRPAAARVGDEDPERYKREVREDTLEDDDRPALEALRQRIKQETTKSTYAIVMVAGEGELSYGQLSIPVWEAYAANHSCDFFLVQKRVSTLNTLRFEWTKPRVLMELIQHAKWKYFWLVDANSLPVQLTESWTYAIGQHMRHKRWKNDDIKKRVIFCPRDCEADEEDHMQQGTCYGPHMSGCIFWTAKDKRKRALRIVKEWYAKRYRQGQSSTGLKAALDETKTRNWDDVFFHDIGSEMGRPESSFLAIYDFSTEYKFNTRDMIADAIKKNRLLGDAANEQPLFEPDTCIGPEKSCKAA